MRTHNALTAAALAVLLTAPVALAQDAPACPEGWQAFHEHRLFFGRNQGDQEVVSDAAWRVFLEDEITARFPDGLTVLDAHGQWRGSTGTLTRERSKLVLVLATPDADALARTDAIVQAYRTTFGQESVLRVVEPVCARF